VTTEKVTSEAFVNHVKLIIDRVKHGKLAEKEKNELLASLEKLLRRIAGDSAKGINSKGQSDSS
jgi:hypothetical protein